MMTRMVIHRARALLRASCVLLGGLLLGSTGLPAAEPAPGAYEVEVVIFRNLDSRGSTPEVAAPVAPALETTPDAGGVQGLDPSALRLTAIAARLRRGPGYQLLYHGGWSQAAPPRAQAAPTPLPAEARRAGLGGDLTLYRDRYLHALVDVSLPVHGDASGRSWHIRQGRRLRGSALQYFDHPGFGLILSVRAPAGVSDAGPASAADEEP
jgi:hypothetical protein